MGRNHQAVLSLIFMLVFSPLYLRGQGAGMRAEVKDYILPQYHASSGRLQFVVFGDRALNKGNVITLENAKIDIPSEDVTTLESARIYVPARGDRIPDFYAVSAPLDVRKKYWSALKQQTVRAWVFADDAVFDKSSNILRSDGPAHFRSRELDVDGVGFDAYSNRKFIHIRSKVKACIYINPDKQKTNARESSSGHQK